MDRLTLAAECEHGVATQRGIYPRIARTRPSTAGLSDSMPRPPGRMVVHTEPVCGYFVEFLAACGNFCLRCSSNI